MHRQHVLYSCLRTLKYRTFAYARILQKYNTAVTDPQSFMPTSPWHSCRDAALFPNYFGQTCLHTLAIIYSKVSRQNPGLWLKAKLAVHKWSERVRRSVTEIRWNRIRKTDKGSVAFVSPWLKHSVSRVADSAAVAACDAAAQSWSRTHKLSLIVRSLISRRTAAAFFPFLALIWYTNNYGCYSCAK